MFFKGCQIVVVWRTSQWNLCKISFYRKWILSSERAKWVFSNFNKRTRYLWTLTIQHVSFLIKGYGWAKNERNSNFQLVSQKVDFGWYLQTVAQKSQWWPTDQFPPKDIHTLSRDNVMRINKLITKEKMRWSFIKFS